MIDIQTLVILIWIHFVADFMLQSDTMAINKSTSAKWLFAHVVIYTTPFFVFGWLFAIVNGVAHGMTDFVTSRAGSWMYERNRHWFFTIIGFDQAVHLSTLVISYYYLVE